MNKFFKTIFLGFTLCLICSCHKVEAATQNGITVYGSNYQVLGSCSNCNQLQSQVLLRDFEKIRYYINSPSLTGGSNYSILFTSRVWEYNTNSPVLPSNCYLYLNNQHLTGTNEYISQTHYECGQDYCMLTFDYHLDRLIQTSQVPDVFMECDFPSAYNLRTNRVEFGINWNYVGSGTVEAINNQSQAIQNANQSNTNSINSHIDSLKNQNTTNSNSIISKIQDVISGLTSGFSNVISAITNGVSTLSQNFGNALGNVGSAITNILTTISNGITGVANTIVQVGSNIVTAIGDGISNLVGTQEVCNIYYQTKNSVVIYGDNNVENGYINASDGIVNSNVTNWFTTPFIKLNGNSDYSLFSSKDSGSQIRFALYDQFYQFISTGVVANGSTLNFSVNNNNNFSYIRYSFPSAQATTILKGDCQKTGLAGIFNRLGDFFNNLFSSILNPTDTIGKLQDITQSSETPISDLLLMPVSLINSLHDSLSSNQNRSYTIPFDFTGGNNTLTFPYIDLEDYLGSSIWSAIDLILSGCMIYAIGMMIISFFESWTSLQDTFDSLYTGQHMDSGYSGKHSGGNRGFFDL